MQKGKSLVTFIKGEGFQNCGLQVTTQGLSKGVDYKDSHRKKIEVLAETYRVHRSCRDHAAGKA